MDQVRIETVKKLDLQPGDILHIKVGGEIDVDGEPDTWVPSVADIEATAELWNMVLPEGTPVVISHHLVESTVIRQALNVASWPPRVKIHD